MGREGASLELGGPFGSFKRESVLDNRCAERWGESLRMTLSNAIRKVLEIAFGTPRLNVRARPIPWQVGGVVLVGGWGGGRGGGRWGRRIGGGERSTGFGGVGWRRGGGAGGAGGGEWG